MRAVSGQEGLKMVLEDFEVSGDHTFIIGENVTGDQLSLSNITVDDGSSGVTIGSKANNDPLSFDIEGADNGRWVIQLPSNTNNMDETDVSFDEAHIDVGTREIIASDIGITNAQWAGGTRFAMGTIEESDGDGGGLQLGIALELDGDFNFQAPAGFDSELEFDGIGGANSCSNGRTNFNVEDDCSGALTWADISADRPLEIEMFNNGSRGLLAFELNPDNVDPAAGQLVVEEVGFSGPDTPFDGESFGEVWTSGIFIRDLQGKLPIDPGLTPGNFSGIGSTGSYCLGCF
jgi:hypothetical protein